MNNNTVIKLHNIRKCFYDYKSNPVLRTLNKIPFVGIANKKWPICDLSVIINCGDIAGITAPDKATLNTLLNILSGSSVPTTGAISVSRPIYAISALIARPTNGPREIITGFPTASENSTCVSGPDRLADLLTNDTDSILIYDEINFTPELLAQTDALLQTLKTKKRDTTTIVFASLSARRLQNTCPKIINAQGDAKKTAALGKPIFVPFIPYAEVKARPIAIGGVGGSGTRLIAGMLRDAGIHIGNDLNKANDNLWLTLLFKQQDLLNATKETVHSRIDIFANAMMGSGAWEKEHVDLLHDIVAHKRAYCTKYWLQFRANTLLTRNFRHDRKNYTFGWKEPNTHLFIDSFKEKFSNMKYLHVCRNGLDMAYSTNQNQVKLWGTYFIDNLKEISPKESLKFWCIANKRALEICENQNIDHLVVNFDNLCTNTKSELSKIASFLQIDYSTIQKYEKIIKRPASIGRFRNNDMSVFGRQDIEYVKKLGFETS